MTLDLFIENLSMIFDFLMSLLMGVADIVTTYYILMVPVAVWVVYRVCKLFKLI